MKDKFHHIKNNPLHKIQSIEIEQKDLGIKGNQKVKFKTKKKNPNY